MSWKQYNQHQALVSQRAFKRDFNAESGSKNWQNNSECTKLSLDSKLQVLKKQKKIIQAERSIVAETIKLKKTCQILGELDKNHFDAKNKRRSKSRQKSESQPQLKRGPRLRLSSTSQGRSHSKPRNRKRSRSPLRSRGKSRGRSPVRSRARPRVRSRSKTPSRIRDRSHVPLRVRSRARSRAPSRARSRAPTRARSIARSRAPSRARSRAPSRARSRAPSRARSRAPSRARSRAPSRARSRAPSRARSRAPSRVRSRAPSRDRCRVPSRARSRAPSRARSRAPSRARSCTPLRIKSQLLPRDPSRTRSRTPSRVSSLLQTRATSQGPSRATSRAPYLPRVRSWSPSQSRSRSRSQVRLRFKSVSSSSSRSTCRSLTRSRSRSRAKLQSKVLIRSRSRSPARLQYRGKSRSRNLSPSRSVRNVVKKRSLSPVSWENRYRSNYTKTSISPACRSIYIPRTNIEQYTYENRYSDTNRTALMICEKYSSPSAERFAITYYNNNISDRNTCSNTTDITPQCGFHKDNTTDISINNRNTYRNNTKRTLQYDYRRDNTTCLSTIDRNTYSNTKNISQCDSERDNMRPIKKFKPSNDKREYLTEKTLSDAAKQFSSDRDKSNTENSGTVNKDKKIWNDLDYLLEEISNESVRKENASDDLNNEKMILKSKTEDSITYSANRKYSIAIARIIKDTAIYTNKILSYNIKYETIQRLRNLLHRRVNLLLKGKCELTPQGIVNMYRKKFPQSNDKFLIQKIHKQITGEKFIDLLVENDISKIEDVSNNLNLNELDENISDKLQTVPSDNKGNKIVDTANIDINSNFTGLQNIKMENDKYNATGTIKKSGNTPQVEKNIAELDNLLASLGTSGSIGQLLLDTYAAALTGSQQGQIAFRCAISALLADTTKTTPVPTESDTDNPNSEAFCINKGTNEEVDIISISSSEAEDPEEVNANEVESSDTNIYSAKEVEASDANISNAKQVVQNDEMSTKSDTNIPNNKENSKKEEGKVSDANISNTKEEVVVQNEEMPTESDTDNPNSENFPNKKSNEEVDIISSSEAEDLKEASDANISNTIEEVTNISNEKEEVVVQNEEITTTEVNNLKHTNKTNDNVAVQTLGSCDVIEPNYQFLSKALWQSVHPISIIIKQMKHCFLGIKVDLKRKVLVVLKTVIQKRLYEISHNKNYLSVGVLLELYREKHPLNSDYKCIDDIMNNLTFTNINLKNKKVDTGDTKIIENVTKNNSDKNQEVSENRNDNNAKDKVGKVTEIIKEAEVKDESKAKDNGNKIDEIKNRIDIENETKGNLRGNKIADVDKTKDKYKDQKTDNKESNDKCKNVQNQKVNNKECKNIQNQNADNKESNNKCKGIKGQKYDNKQSKDIKDRKANTKNKLGIRNVLNALKPARKHIKRYRYCEFCYLALHRPTVCPILLLLNSYSREQILRERNRCLTCLNSHIRPCWFKTIPCANCGYSGHTNFTCHQPQNHNY